MNGENASGVPRVAAILAVFNRREMTMRCLRQLTSGTVALRQMDIYVVDDGSSDGTSAAIAAEFPLANLIQGTGGLYWGGGMKLAEEAALRSDPDYLLWVNDDLELANDGIQRLLEVARTSEPPAAVVGALVGSGSDTTTTYSGMRRVVNPLGFLRMVRVEPDPLHSVVVDSFNGNLVLIPTETVRAVGGIDPRLRHFYGDLDMGLRIKSSGRHVLLSPGHLGLTSRNSPAGTFRDPGLSRHKRAKHLFSPKGFPIRSRGTYLRRHGGALWFLDWLGFYLVWLARIAIKR